MKTKIYSLFAILTLSVTAWSQGVGINETGANPDGSAILDASSTTKGFLPPRMTTAQRNAISNPANGLTIFNTDDNLMQVNTGTPASPVWQAISPGAQGVQGPAGPQGPTGLLPNGSAAGNTPYWNGTAWVVNSSNIHNNGGNVGIGTTNPSTKLHVQGMSRFEANSSTGQPTVLQFTSPGAAKLLELKAVNEANGAIPANTWQFRAGTSSPTANVIFSHYDFPTLAIINESNRVGIGTSTPESQLHVMNNARVDGVVNVRSADGNDAGSILTTNEADLNNGLIIRSQRGLGKITFETNAGGIQERMRINANGNVGIGTTDPTQRLDIDGQLRIRGGSPAAGRVLTSDANGVATWQNLPAQATYIGSTSITLSGTSFQRAALTGDVTAAANSNATTIANGAVTAAKLNSMGASNGQVLKWNGSAWAPAADNNDNTTYTGSTSITLSGTSFQRAALTGDVTAAANSNATTIANNAVTTAKINNGAVTAAKMSAGSGVVNRIPVADASGNVTWNDINSVVNGVNGAVTMDLGTQLAFSISGSGSIDRTVTSNKGEYISCEVQNGPGGSSEVGNVTATLNAATTTSNQISDSEYRSISSHTSGSTAQTAGFYYPKGAKVRCTFSSSTFGSLASRRLNYLPVQ